MTIILDAGHGGMYNGEYQTAGKRSPQWPGVTPLFEGEFNRAIVARIRENLTWRGIKYVDITHPYEDTDLTTRVSLANYIGYSEGVENCLLVSIHANAGGGSGFEVWTSPGETPSDKYATVFVDKYADAFPHMPVRMDMSDGDPDKENRFRILVETAMPAVLTENFFMDNKMEVEQILNTRWGRDQIALFHVKAISHIIHNRKIFS